MSDSERKTLESVRAWLEGDARWFALEDQDGLAVIVCSERKLRELVGWSMPGPETAAEFSAIANCREFLEGNGERYARLEISPGMYAHFGTRATLEQAAAVVGE
jgi:hypothetical protein